MRGPDLSMMATLSCIFRCVLDEQRAKRLWHNRMGYVVHWVRVKPTVRLVMSWFERVVTSQNFAFESLRVMVTVPAAMVRFAQRQYCLRFRSLWVLMRRLR